MINITKKQARKLKILGKKKVLTLKEEEILQSFLRKVNK